jgi:hypothetical protein
MGDYAAIGCQKKQAQGNRQLVRTTGAASRNGETNAGQRRLIQPTQKMENINEISFEKFLLKRPARCVRRLRSQRRWQRRI